VPHLKLIKGNQKKRAEKANPTSHRDDSTDYEMGEDEELLLEELQSMFRAAIRNKEEVQSLMLEGEEVYQSGSLNENIPEVQGIEQEIDTNFAKSLVRNVQSRVTDSNPRPVAVKRNPDDQLFAEIVDDTLQWILDVNDWRRERDKIIVDCTNKGVSFARVMWDGSMSQDEGNISVSHINPLQVYPGSHTDDLQCQDRLFVVHAEPVSKVIRKMKRLNEAVDEEDSKVVGPSEDLEKKILDAAGQSPAVEVQASDLAKMLSSDPKQGPIHRLKDKKESTSSTIGSSEQIHEGNVNYIEAYIEYPEGHSLHEDYPKGRLVFFTHTGILGDFAWQKDHWPFDKFELEPSSDYFWNDPVIMPIADIQQSINALSNLIQKASTVHAFPPFLTTPQSGITRDEFEETGPANRVLHVEPGALSQGAGWMQPPPIPEAAFQLRNKYIQEMEQILGVHDITQGRTPGSIQSGSAIARLQEADQAQLRSMIRQLNKGLKRMGEMVFENIQDHLTQERFIHVGDSKTGRAIQLNKNASVQKARQWLQDREKRNDKRAMEIIKNAQQKLIQQNAMKETAGEKVKLDPTVGSVDIRIGGGSDSKMSQVAKAQDALRLAEMGILDARGVLEALDWNDKERVLRKVDREKQLAAEVESLQERVNNTESVLNEIVHNLDQENQQQVQRAISTLMARRASENGQG